MITNNKLIAITGGIGSGKSTLLKIFGELGYPAYSADEIYSDLLKKEDFVLSVCSSVGVEPLVGMDGIEIDRKSIAEKVFSNDDLLKKLNAVTHGAIMSEMKNRAESANAITFCEVPLLFEGGYEKLFDLVIVVTRSEDERVKSVEIRDGKTKENIKSIIKNQFDYSKIIEDGHTIIVENDGDLSALRKNAEKILDYIGNKI